VENLKHLLYLILLITNSTLFALLENKLPQIVFQDENSNYLIGPKEWSFPTTYDEILELLDDLESGEAEKKYSLSQLDRINNYLITLCKEGLLPNEVEEDALNEDVYDLVYGENSVYQLRFSEKWESKAIPLVLTDNLDCHFLPCGKISHAWKKTKKFVKKHKKEIIIGAAVVVAVTVVAVAVVATSSASAATGAAGAALGASSASGTSDSNHSKTKSDNANSEDNSTSSELLKKILPFIEKDKTPIIESALVEQASSLKELLVEEKSSQDLYQGEFNENVREIGAYMAHKALDEISELVKIVPQFCEEVKEIGSKFLPDSLKKFTIKESVSPLERHDYIVAIGHDAIDNVFTTNQAGTFLEKVKENEVNKNWVIGLLPPPSPRLLSKALSDTSHLKEAGKVLDRGGFTKAGRALMKHGNRKGSFFPKPSGNVEEMNRRGQMVLEDILSDSNKIVLKNSRGDIEIYSANGRGVYFKKDGSFRGFINYGKK